MRILLWKDWRQARALALAALIMYLAPIPVALVWALLSPPEERPRRLWEWGQLGMVSALAGLVFSLFALPMIGAALLARERREWTATFLESLPVGRGRVVASKALVTLAVAAGPWVLFAPMTLGLSALLRDAVPPAQRVDFRVPGDVLAILVGVALLPLGLAWLLSALMSRETPAALIAFVATVVAAATLGVVEYRLDATQEVVAAHYLLVLGGMGIAGLIAGTVVELRRWAV